MTGRKKWVLACSAAAAVLIGGAAGAYLIFRRQAPDLAKATAAQVVQYLASEEFGRLSENDRQGYFDQARRRSDGPDVLRQARQLPAERQKTLRENTSALFLRAFVEPYYKLPPDQRVAYLDRIISIRQAARSLMPLAGSQGPSGSGAPGGASGAFGGAMRFGQNLAPQDLRGLIEKTDPLRRAQFVGFLTDLEKRMAQRGLPVPR